MNHSEKETCIYCKFYKQTRIEHGQCRCQPPVGVGENFVGKWPEVADTYWCGEFQKGEGSPQRVSAMNYVPRPKPQAAQTKQPAPQQRTNPQQ